MGRLLVAHFVIVLLVLSEAALQGGVALHRQIPHDAQTTLAASFPTLALISDTLVASYTAECPDELSDLYVIRDDEDVGDF